MPIVTLDTLKTYFANAAVPNYDNYVDVIDSLSANPGAVTANYLNLIGLRGFWPPSSISTTPSLIDISNNHHLLTKNGTGASIAYDDDVAKFIPYSNLYSGQYFYLVDNAALSITGTELYIHSARRGLTIGCWLRVPVRPDEFDTGIIGKYTTGQRSYLLYRTAAGRFRFTISTNGTAVVNAESTQTISLSYWHFLVGRFNPSTELAIFHNGYWVKNTTSIPASIYDSTARFEIGSFEAGLTSTTWTHNGSLYFITASALTDLQIENLYKSSMPLFRF